MLLNFIKSCMPHELTHMLDPAAATLCCVDQEARKKAEAAKRLVCSGAAHRWPPMSTHSETQE